MTLYKKYIENENILVRLKTKTGIGFWQHQLFGILSLFMEKSDFFFVTEKTLLISSKNKF